LSIVHFSATIFFDHHEFGKSFSFEGRKSIVAKFTLSSSSNALTIFNGSRIDDFCIHVLAFWAFHKTSGLNGKTLKRLNVWSLERYLGMMNLLL
jgi:hypothetical protein